MKYLLNLFLLLLSIKGFSQAETFEKRTFTDKEGHILPYRILFPENYDASKKYPIVLVLHGAGERGNDNEKQLTHGSKLFLSPENRQKFPAIVIFPQCPTDSYWASVKIDRSKSPLDIDFTYNEQPNWPLVAAVDLVKQISKTEKVDKNRIYIMGLSMGGMGTFEAIARNPKLFAAAVPICGGANLTWAKKYAQTVPVWIFHGDADGVVKVGYSRDMYAALRALEAKEVKYTEYPNVNHNSWDNAFAEPNLLSWLFEHKK
ncbi:carboxylesterase family protein [Flectobacillus rivi]|uniref:Prolyl oligopeptidase family serine peptidase n=1 Tax=Flectobacillus rivi TaxID=2984209 RepID=A0ABT6YZE6_9BACT|nr:prolyl oligopeptidase family serine peptidase [Flectobacillus rivi]MDI9874245.1 prolyl oligopeptidase family serine peptidase [Flectobacillus rivi]